ncbi:SCO7613 C-terminal domain-containing membrane protein, partial [Allorhizocola rhizosphaerae]|uniref:SCO7613 C-terminal domain-containing membrane protein n=1 Tax=Allorhizocola rhizosphaerae TaxID=1872709 RepID=UPI003CCC6334
TRPGSMAAAGTAAPAIIAVASLAPALRASLVTPHENLNRIWQGPPPPLPFAVDNSAVVTAVLLTIAAAVAAVGFGGGMTRAVSVVVPGAALTILITPVSVGMPWPASVMAGLITFTLCMLSVALTFPPEHDESTSGTRAARIAVLLIGLVAGGAGLAGSLATPEMTIFTFAGAVGVGLTAAMWGKVERARITGWLGGALAAQMLVLSVSLHIGAAAEWAAFGVLAVGAALITSASLLPRFTRPDAVAEASAIEWAGYLAGVIAVMLALRSPAHVAALLVGFGAMLAMAATRAGRPSQQRRVLFWLAAGSTIVAWWLIMRRADVALPEAYTIPFALLALAVGIIEIRQRPHLGSWAAYGPALIAAFGPTVVVVIATEPNAARIIGLLVAGIAVLIWGSQTQQRAPVAIGAVVTTIVAFHALTLVGTTWLAVGIAGIVLLIIGASSERRRRATERYNKFR